MNGNLSRAFNRPAVWLLVAGSLLAAAPSASAALVTFDFDSGTPTPAAQSTSTPFTNTITGVTASLSAYYDFPGNPGYSLQSNATFAGSIHLNAPFGGNFLSPGNTQGPLYIAFSQPIDSISLSFATADANQNEDGTYLQIVAYVGAVGSTPLGSNSGNAAYGSGGVGATYPEGTLSFSSGTAFSSVMVRVSPTQTSASSPPAAAFFVDNVVVNAVPESGGLALFGPACLAMLLRPCRRKRTGSST